MKRTLLSIVAFLFATLISAQTSRRTIERFANEAVKQITLTGRTPTIDLLDSLANNAEVSIEMISRMDYEDDVRSQKACLRLITNIVDYSQQTTGRKYTDVVRKGLTKALDRSYDTEVQQLVMNELGRCAKPADAAHIAMYLEMPTLESTATRILLDMPDIDDRIAEAAANQPGIKAKVKSILDIRAGRKSASSVAATSPVKKPEPVAIPMWTESLDRAIADMCHEPMPAADSIIIRFNAERALPELISMANRSSEEYRDGILARCIMLAERVAERGELAADKCYLLMRDADLLTTNSLLRSKIILNLGQTHSIQALSYLRRYTGKTDLADAMAIASTEIIGSRPDANGGRAVNTMLYAAKQSFIRHYDETGIDNYIDQALAAIDNWKIGSGYDMSHTDETRMGKRGFWILHDELQDFNLVFDWQAEGTLTLSLRSTPLLLFNRNLGIRLQGDNQWHKFNAVSDWSTACVSLVGNVLTVSINGQTLIDAKHIDVAPSGEPLAKSGEVRFLADDNGAIVRQYCFSRK